MTDLLTDGVAEADPTYWVPKWVDQPVVRALTSDGFPVKPPREWFADPGLNGPTPLVVENDGRVFGHAACWHQSHIGLAGGIKPPRSRSRYAFFATGALETDSGDMVDVGQITLVGGHAPIDAPVARAVQHYDDTRSGVADVAIGEDNFGIWVAGALRPDVDAAKVRVLRASSVSGDWRPINGNLELVAISSVPVPGFPIPRARVASGQVLALVAAGVEPLVEERLRQFSAAAVMEAVDALSDRLDMVEGIVVPPSDFQAEMAEEHPEVEVDELAPSVTETAEGVLVDSTVVDLSAVNRMRYRVHAPLLVEDPEVDADALRKRVHLDAEPS